MRNVFLGSSSVSISAVGLGCAGLYRNSRVGDRRRILEEAFENGITHFDTAPIYGFGLSEIECGSFAQGRRDRITLTTKVGIRPSRLAMSTRGIQGRLRRLVGSVAAHESPRLAKPRGRRLGQYGKDKALVAEVLEACLYRRDRIDPPTIRKQLENSLRVLRTDYIDLYLLHEPPLEELGLRDDLVDLLERQVEEGNIRAWGVGGHYPDTDKTWRMLEGVPVVQLEVGLLDPPLQNPTTMGVLTFGTLGSSLGLIDRYATRSRESTVIIDGTLIDLRDRSLLVRLIGSLSLERNPSGGILVSTARTEHVAALASIGTSCEENDNLRPARQALWTFLSELASKETAARLRSA